MKTEKYYKQQNTILLNKIVSLQKEKKDIQRVLQTQRENNYVLKKEIEKLKPKKK